MKYFKKWYKNKNNIVNVLDVTISLSPIKIKNEKLLYIMRVIKALE